MEGFRLPQNQRFTLGKALRDGELRECRAMGRECFLERRYPRADVSLSASYEWFHASGRHTGWVVNIGVGGLRLVGENDDVGAVGSEVVVELPLPRVGREMLLRGGVVALTRAADGTCGFSVAFAQIDARDREAIGFLVESTPGSS